MEGASLPLAVLAAVMAVLIYLEIRSERPLGAFHWMTFARYPRGFPIYVGCHVLILLWLIFFAAMFALGWL